MYFFNIGYDRYPMTPLDRDRGYVDRYGGGGSSSAYGGSDLVRKSTELFYFRRSIKFAGIFYNRIRATIEEVMAEDHPPLEVMADIHHMSHPTGHLQRAMITR